MRPVISHRCIRLVRDIRAQLRCAQVATFLALAPLFICGSAGASAAQPALTIVDEPFMAFIAGMEGPDGYDDVTLHATSQPPDALTRMTIGQVLDYQARLQRQGAKSTAVGQYQVIRKTLNDFVRRGEIRPDELYSANNQDRLARILMNRCNFYDPAHDIDRLGNCLARAWAALPVMTGRKAGQSHYQGKAGNRALTSVEEVRQVLEGRFRDEGPIMVAARRIERLPAISSRAPDRASDPIPLARR
ncbi:hypothetical protein [Paracoccus sp. ME4]|uniref:hypothetical protein n=1 Tax=Paracoccus sp. ME4 TaxID=3138066 RepID=UPI00398AA7F0